MREELAELIMNSIYSAIEELWDNNVEPVLQDDVDGPEGNEKEWAQAHDLTARVKTEFCEIMDRIAQVEFLHKENPEKKGR